MNVEIMSYKHIENWGSFHLNFTLTIQSWSKSSNYRVVNQVLLQSLYYSLDGNKREFPSKLNFDGNRLLKKMTEL